MTLLEWPGVGFLIFVTELEARVFLLSSLDPSGRPRISTGERVSVERSEMIDGRAAWYTPWGDPADVRSISVALDGAIYVNVHVGGVVRSRDGGRSWAPTVDIESDVHQVLAHPSRAEVVLAAAADGFGVSRDGGASWRFLP